LVVGGADDGIQGCENDGECDGVGVCNDFCVGDLSDAISTNATVRNNTIYNGSTGGGGTGIKIGSSQTYDADCGAEATAVEYNLGTSHEVHSNAIHSDHSSSFDCFNYELENDAAFDIAFTLADYNTCYAPNVVEDWVGGPITDYTIGTFQAITGAPDTNSNADTDPGYTDTSGALPGDIDLSPSSPSSALIGAGHPTLTTALDFDGVSRIDPEDAGAYEWLSLNMNGTTSTGVTITLFEAWSYRKGPEPWALYQSQF
jgi:hypothetical protein